MKKGFFVLVIGLTVISACKQNEYIGIPLELQYLEQETPGTRPEVFAPGIVSDTSWAEHSQLAISPKGDEIYWSAWSSEYPPEDTTWGKNSEQIYFCKFENGEWSKPALAEFTKDHLKNINGGPVFSLDGKRLYFYSVERPGGIGAMDTWFVEKTDGEWSKPINAGEAYNTKRDDWSPVFTSAGYAYQNFRKTIKFNFSEGEFSNPDTIIIHEDFNPTFPIYVAPDESYVIFDSHHKDGFGGLDLYISFKSRDGSWGYPINMGNEINSDATERFPVVSPDGKYLFFMRHTKTQDFFWVSTEIIETLKETTQDN